MNPMCQGEADLPPHYVDSMAMALVKMSSD